MSNRMYRYASLVAVIALGLAGIAAVDAAAPPAARVTPVARVRTVTTLEWYSDGSCRLVEAVPIRTTEDAARLVKIMAQEEALAAGPGEDAGITNRQDRNTGQCTATTTKGERCRNRAAPGDSVCAVHR